MFLLDTAKFQFQLEELHIIVGSKDYSYLEALLQPGGLLRTTGLKKITARSWCSGYSNHIYSFHSDYNRNAMAQPISKTFERIRESRSNGTIQDSVEIYEFFNRDFFRVHPHITYINTDLNLSSLSITTAMDNGFKFGKNLNELHLSFRWDRDDGDRIAATIDSLISAIPTLEHLSLGGLIGFKDSPWWCSLTLTSDSVRTIDVTLLEKQVFFCRVSAPKLERFRCIGSYYGNGVRTQDLRNRYPYAEYHESRSMTGKYCVGDTPFFGMDVPPTCEVELRDF